jgi:hypothetical protein
LAHIAVVNSPLSLSNRTPPDGISSSAGWSGLEIERVCELVVSGQGDSVELARVRLLVMLDELVSDQTSEILIFASKHQNRVGYMQTYVRLTTNYTLSLLAENAMCFGRFKKRPGQTFTFLHPCKVW